MCGWRYKPSINKQTIVLLKLLLVLHLQLHRGLLLWNHRTSQKVALAYDFANKNKPIDLSFPTVVILIPVLHLQLHCYSCKHYSLSLTITLSLGCMEPQTVQPVKSLCLDLDLDILRWQIPTFWFSISGTWGSTLILALAETNKLRL